METTTFPTEFRYRTTFAPEFGGGMETGVLRLLEPEAFDPNWPDYLDTCEGCRKPAMWANTPDDIVGQGYSGLCWCTSCWFNL